MAGGPGSGEPLQPPRTSCCALRTSFNHVPGVQQGGEMLAQEHYGSQSIGRKSTLVSSRWRKLQDKMADRGDKLRQAGQQEQLMELLQVRTTPG